MLRSVCYYFAILGLFFPFYTHSQITFPWSGTYGGAGASRTYTTTVSGITMSATIVNSENVWQDGSPVWFPTGSSVSGSGCAGIGATNQGMLLSTDWSTNTTKTITTTITFSSAIKGPVNFRLYDINDDGSGSWMDKIIVSGTNAASSAVNVFNVGTACVSTGGSVAGSGTNTLTYNSGMSSACTCWGNNEVNVGTSSDCIKTITIQYKSSTTPTNYNNPKQYVVVSNIVANNATTVTAPSGITGTLSICSGGSTTLTATGGNATTQWYSGSCGGTSAGTGASISVSPGSTTTYYAANSNGCATSACASTTVTVSSPPNAGADGSTSVCETSGSAVDLFSLIAGEDAGGTWTRLTGSGGTFNSGAGTFTPAAGATSSTFQYTVTGTAPCSNDVSLATITISAAPNAGSNGILVICQGSTVTAPQLFSSLTGTPDAGGTWSPALAGAGTYTYTVTVAGCTDATASVTVTEQAQPNAGTNGTLDICEGTTVTAVDLFGALTGTPDAGGTWSPALAGAGTYTYTVAATAPCATDATSTVTVTEQAQPNAGTNGTLDICAGTTVTAADLFGALTGTPDAGGTWSPAFAGAGTYTYTVAATAPCATDATAQVVVSEIAAPNAGSNGSLVICQGSTVTAPQLYSSLTGTPDAGGTWSPVLAGAGTYSYTVTVAGCTDATASVTVTEQAQPNAGTNGTLDICAGTTVTASDLFGALTGTPQSGGTWSPALAGAGTYTYTVAATAPCATDATAQVIVSEIAAPNAGSNGSLVICQGSTVTAPQLYSSLTGTPDAGGTWSPALAGAGMYTYTVAATAPCATDATSTVTVTEQAQPNAGTNGILDICAGTTVTTADLFGALTGTPDAGGTWSPALAGAGTYTYTVAATAPCATDATAQVTVSEIAAPNAGSNGTLVICQGSTVTAPQLFSSLTGTPDAGGTWLPALIGAGTYTYTVTVAGCTDATASVTVTEQAQPNAGTNGTLNICAGTTVTAADLFGALSGTPQSGGTWSPALAGAGTYTYTVAATAPCATDVVAQVILTVSNCEIVIPSGFTPSGDGVNETWELIGLDDKYPNNKVYIYNRWGNLIFESKQGDYMSQPWDGTFEGKPLPVSSFYYMIYTDPEQEGEIIKGTLTILKQ